GGSVPTRELLDFGLAHARARDAVWMPFDRVGLVAELESAGLKAIALDSAATSRDEYLRRPDLGRRLSDESRDKLAALTVPGQACDLCFIVSDGLSSLATRHALSIVVPLHARLATEGWSVAPILVVRFGRVALQDEIGQRLGATLSLMLLGERPGLGSPDSLGAYFVYGPQAGRLDADRNCVSNIRPDGLPPNAAVETLHCLLTASRHRRLSGVDLKDERVLPMQTKAIR
ncbi:MAG: ethanolamine ammonia-lyase subunit EutC, partial [Candidatus Saccharimonas sp.]|nr:ethanolamine ammonia-lyase subunit EutC [Planctomycetaceae bacterium]